MIATLQPPTIARQVQSPRPPSRVEELQQTVSASRLGLWQSCRLKFYFKYVLRIQKAATPARHFGKVVHAVLQAWNKARWRKQSFSPDRFKTVFDLGWKENQKEIAINWDGEEEAERTGAIPIDRNLFLVLLPTQ